MTTIDLRKELKSLYRPGTKEIAVVQVPAMNFLMIDGAGNPNTSREYAAALGALYTVAYTLKFAVKRGPLAVDYPVMPLEGLWWADDMDAFTPGKTDKDAWKWTMMIMQPDFTNPAMVADAVEDAKKRKGDMPALSLLRFGRFEEGLAAQIMFTGAYADEGPVIMRIHEFIERTGRVISGKHHEIYISDPNRTAPDKLKTVIRQPMR